MEKSFFSPFPLGIWWQRHINLTDFFLAVRRTTNFMLLKNCQSTDCQTSNLRNIRWGIQSSWNKEFFFVCSKYGHVGNCYIYVASEKWDLFSFISSSQISVDSIDLLLFSLRFGDFSLSLVNRGRRRRGLQENLFAFKGRIPKSFQSPGIRLTPKNVPMIWKKLA